MSNNEFSEFKRQRAVLNQQIAEQKSAEVRNYLITREKTRLQTAFIHAIAQVEQLFGHLWDESSQAEEVEGPEYYRKLFEQFRKSVLDNGNNQVRNMSREMEAYDFAFRKVNLDIGNPNGQK